MYLNEPMLQRLARDRTRELAREASGFRAQRQMNPGWRTRAARSLMALAERLEPSAAPSGRNLARH